MRTVVFILLAIGLYPGVSLGERLSADGKRNNTSVFASYDSAGDVNTGYKVYVEAIVPVSSLSLPQQRRNQLDTFAMTTFGDSTAAKTPLSFRAAKNLAYQARLRVEFVRDGKVFANCRMPRSSVAFRLLYDTNSQPIYSAVDLVLYATKAEISSPFPSPMVRDLCKSPTSGQIVSPELKEGDRLVLRQAGRRKLISTSFSLSQE